MKKASHFTGQSKNMTLCWSGRTDLPVVWMVSVFADNLTLESRGEFNINTCLNTTQETPINNTQLAVPVIEKPRVSQPFAATFLNNLSPKMFPSGTK